MLEADDGPMPGFLRGQFVDMMRHRVIGMLNFCTRDLNGRRI